MHTLVYTADYKQRNAITNRSEKRMLGSYLIVIQLIFTCSKLAIETLEKVVKYIQS